MSQIEAISLIESSKQALEALKEYAFKGVVTEKDWQGYKDTIKALEAALEAHKALAQPQSDIKQEPVAEPHKSTECVGEPVAWGNFKEDGALVGLSQHPEDQANWTNRKPLYTHPQPKREPLTDEQIEKLLDAVIADKKTKDQIGDFARAIEAAHGIKE